MLNLLCAKSIAFIIHFPFLLFVLHEYDFMTQYCSVYEIVEVVVSIDMGLSAAFRPLSCIHIHNLFYIRCKAEL